MSLLSKKSIQIPIGATVARLADDQIVVKGPLGQNTVKLLPGLAFDCTAQEIRVRLVGSNRQARMNQGTMWSLVRNALEGVVQGFSKILEIEGLGYRSSIEGQEVVLSLGYVNPVRVAIPAGLKVTVEKKSLVIRGPSKDQVGRLAAKIRALKKPEPYKGKGIYYRGEVIHRKVGKKAAVSQA